MDDAPHLEPIVARLEHLDAFELDLLTVLALANVADRARGAPTVA